MLKYKGNAFLLWRSIIAEEFVKTGLMDGMGENNDDDDFKNDPEGESNAKKYRLPFALCKAKGIKIQDW